MKTYYKGTLLKSRSLDYSTCTIRAFTCTEVYPSNLSRSALKLNKIDFEYLKKNLNSWANDYSKITDNELVTILDKVSHVFKEDSPNTPDIIYEIVESTDGKHYGKELLTGLLFPIQENGAVEYFYNFDDHHAIEKRTIYNDSNLDRFMYIINCFGVASLNDVEKYLKIKNRKFGSKTFINKIKRFYNENVFNKEIVLKDQIALETQNEITKLMEDIEFILIDLRQHNEELYNKYSNEYKKICNINNDNLKYSEPSKKELTTLLSNLKLSLLIKNENCNDMIDYLNVLIEKYFEKILYNSEIDIDLNIRDLDNLTDIFLKSKDIYIIQEQRNILTKLSLLYLLIVKCNVDRVDINDLENGYFKSNIKTVILNILELRDLGIISTITNTKLLKETKVDFILNEIKNIKFNTIEKDKIKQLIK